MDKGISIYYQDGRKIVKGLGYYEASGVKDLKELVKKSAKKYGNSVGFKFKDSNGRIVGKTYNEFDQDVDTLGTALISLGLKEKHIAIIGENRYEWAVCYFSVVNGTGVVVPLDKNLPKNEVENLIERGKIEAIFYSRTFHSMMIEIAQVNSRVKYFICMDEIPDINNNDSKFVTLNTLKEKGKTLLESGDRNFVDAEIDRNKMSLLFFTSGTTSISKGVMLSHANVASNVTSVTTVIHADQNDVFLSILPLHHTYENTVGMLAMINFGTCIAYCEGIRYIAQNILEFGVTILIGVPAIFEAIYKKLNEGIKKSGKAGLIKVLLVISETLRFFGIDIRRKIFKPIFDKLGPKLRLGVSGAAPIDPKVIKGFNALGYNLMEGYGLTEASPIVATNNDFVNRPGTIGYPMGGIEVAIDNPDENGIGEIIVRGDNVMLGYYEEPIATQEAIDKDGWLRTGDVGFIDKDGFIKITGRIKSMIVLTNGKKAFPEEYEILLNKLPGVKESFVWGNKAPDGDIQVCAKLVVDKERMVLDKGYMPSEEEMAREYEAAIKEINKRIPQYKIIRYFLITYEELVKTTTLKTKRSVEQEKVKAMLEKAGLEIRKASGKVIEKLCGDTQ